MPWETAHHLSARPEGEQEGRLEKIPRDPSGRAMMVAPFPGHRSAQPLGWVLATLWAARRRGEPRLACTTTPTAKRTASMSPVSCQGSASM